MNCKKLTEATISAICAVCLFGMTVLAADQTIELLTEQDKPIQIGDAEGNMTDIRHITVQGGFQHRPKWEKKFSVAQVPAKAQIFVKIFSLSPNVCPTVLRINGKDIKDLGEYGGGTDKMTEATLDVIPASFVVGPNTVVIEERTCSIGKNALNDSILYKVAITLSE